MNRRRWPLAVLAAAMLALAVAGGRAQTSMIFPAPPPGRQPPFPGNVVRVPGAAFVYFEGAKVAAYFHGNGEDLADLAPMISLLRSLGLGVLAVEYPGYGIAGGTPSEDGAYDAAERALRWLRSERGVGDERVILLGQSLGSGVASEMAKRGFGARMILISPFTSVVAMARHLFPIVPSIFVRHRFDTESKAAAIALPVLIIHGTRDEVVPFEMGERLSRVFPRAQLVRIPDGGHNDLLSRHASSLRAALAAFLR